MENKRFSESWESAKRDTVLINMGIGKDWLSELEDAAKLMAERYEAEIAELEDKIRQHKDLLRSLSPVFREWENQDESTLGFGWQREAKELLK